MKRSLLLVLLIMVSVVAFSQSTPKGPKAKNAAVAELAVNSSPMKFYQVPSNLTGPESKNLKIWEKVAANTETIYVRRELDLPKGPKAKNKKVWKD